MASMITEGPGSGKAALSIDVEDWFQVSDFEDKVRHEDWDKYESRVVANTRRVLARHRLTSGRVGYEDARAFLAIGLRHSRTPHHAQPL